MSGFGTTLKELINPSWVRHNAVPPLEAGLRPNQKLDRAELVAESFEVFDMVALPDGSVAMAHDDELYRFRDGVVGEVIARLDGAVTALAVVGSTLVAAVHGRGLVDVGTDGQVTTRSDDPRLFSCVTAMSGLPDGSLAVTVGSATHTYAQWKHALVAGDRSGSVLVVEDRDGKAAVRVLADRLAWPAGVCEDRRAQLLVSVANAHRIDTVDLSSGRSKPLLTNLPAYPGRIATYGDAWLVSFPYVRNRLSELLLEERDFVDQMVSTISPDEWMVPRLRNDNPYTSALQLGQLRVLGVLKPWAPARSYGLLGVLESSGRFAAGYHSRVDGHQHGVTSAVPVADGILVGVCGSRNLLLLNEEAA